MKRIILSIIILCGLMGFEAQGQALGAAAPADTQYFHHKDFEWQVTPRYDYSKTLMGKFFLSQAHYDQRYKLRDNGKQTVYMNCAEALEAIKAMDAITLGLPKVFYLVGWQYNGHDSKYPAFFECNEAFKAPGDSSAYQSILNLMEEARKYNTSISFHINMYDCYDDSPFFDKYVKDDVLARYEDGEYIFSDYGYCVSYARDWATGNARARLDSLCKLFPVSQSGTIHIDAFHSRNPIPVVEGDEVDIRFISPISPYHKISSREEVEAQLNVIKYLDSKGIDVTSEYCPEETFYGYMTAVWHRSGDHHYITHYPWDMPGTNSGNHMSRVFGHHVNPESAFREEGTMKQRFENFKKGFCEWSLPHLYLNRLTPVAYIEGPGEDYCEALFSDGVRTTWSDGNFSMYKDGVKMAGEGNFFVPVQWAGDNIVVAFSKEGCANLVWTVPEGVSCKGSTAKVYTVDDEGEHYKCTLKVRRHTVALTLSPGEMLKLEF